MRPHLAKLLTNWVIHLLTKSPIKKPNRRIIFFIFLFFYFFFNIVYHEVSKIFFFFTVVPIFSKHWPSGPMLSISRFVRLSLCLFVRVFTFEVPFKCLFAPPSWSRMSNIFRDSESLGKSNEKKWSQMWTFLFGIGLKSPKKMFFFGWFCPTKHGGNHAHRWIRDRWSKGVSLIMACF